MVELAQTDQMPMDATQWCVYDMAQKQISVAAAAGCDNGRRTFFENTPAARSIAACGSGYKICLVIELFFCRDFPHFKSCLCTRKILG